MTTSAAPSFTVELAPNKTTRAPHRAALETTVATMASAAPATIVVAGSALRWYQQFCCFGLLVVSYFAPRTSPCMA